MVLSEAVFSQLYHLHVVPLFLEHSISVGHLFLSKCLLCGPGLCQHFTLSLTDVLLHLFGQLSLLGCFTHTDCFHQLHPLEDFFLGLSHMLEFRLYHCPAAGITVSACPCCLLHLLRLFTWSAPGRLRHPLCWLVRDGCERTSLVLGSVSTLEQLCKTLSFLGESINFLTVPLHLDVPWCYRRPVRNQLSETLESWTVISWSWTLNNPRLE